MRIYVSTSWENKKMASLVMEWLTELGHEITLDWTKHEIMNWRAQDSTKIKAGGWARDDISIGVNTADLVVILLEGVDKIRTGTAAEMGAAFSKGIPVILYGNQTEPESAFFYHPLVVKTLPSKISLLYDISRLDKLREGLGTK